MRPPPIVANARTSNIFTPEQEMVFGDLMVENRADELRFVRDERLLAYVNEIGARLVRHLPLTGLTFRFHIIDLPDANALNIPGGHVFLSRKLLLSSKTRGGLWDLSAGERKFYVRGFRGGLVWDDGGSVGEFPTLDETPHSLVLLNPKNNTVAPLRELPEDGARQYGRFVLLAQPFKDG